MNISMISVIAAALLSAGPQFDAARPVWPKGRETRMNDSAEFRASFEVKRGDNCFLRVAGCSAYRIRFDGEVVGYGPARAAKGFFRVDEWPLHASTGRHWVAIEVSAYNVPSFCAVNHEPFLQAEVVTGGRIAASTGACSADGAPGLFRAFETARVTKTTRYSYQRAFGEAYMLDQHRTGVALELAERPPVALIERIAPLPDLGLREMKFVSMTGTEKPEAPKYRKMRFVDELADWFGAYRVDELDVNIWKEIQTYEMKPLDPSAPSVPLGEMRFGDGALFDRGHVDTGFIGARIECLKPGRLIFAFDEILSDGRVNPSRYSVSNGIVVDSKVGTCALESFEPYTLRYLHIFPVSGEFRIADVRFRTYRNPDAAKAKFRSSDPELDEIFAAARETFAQNAVDVFMDCPGRERAGWLCDSYFTGRSAAIFTGSTDLERLFVQNFLLPGKFDDIPEGMVPMCYPSDHPNGSFIPNWAMWLVLELEEYLARSGDRAMIDAFKPRVMGIVDFLKKCRNKDGLLENLPGWVFVDADEANSYTKGVNYPSNMTWADTLDCVARLYGVPELADEAARVREAVRRQSWTGEWFCDNALRGEDGALKLSGKCTEACQYYAFMSRTATPESHPDLWRRVLGELGPGRREKNPYPWMSFANIFIANHIRLETLSRAGLDRQVVSEVKGYFGYMAKLTGTLWENNTARSSCNHAVSSHAAVLMFRHALGIKAIDLVRKTVTVAPADAGLEFCEAEFPVPGGTVEFGWKGVGADRKETFRAPEGWRKVSL